MHDIIPVERRWDTEKLSREYLSSMKDGFGRGYRAGAERLDAIAAELHSRGVSEIRTIFGSIEVSTDWSVFQARQREALAQRHKSNNQ